MLALRALEVTFADAKQAVNIPDDLAKATKKGFAPIERAIVPLALVLFAAVSLDSAQVRQRQPCPNVT
ncbi:MAG: hypothetical protein H7255_04785 [Ramlibacter sp.]|nr:hypothetical protein [Ramlibacter sp.]